MDTAARKPFTHRARDWFLWRAGPGLSKVGEKLNLNWLVYNPLLYYSFNELALRNAPSVIGAIANQFPEAQRFIDVGAGGGAFAAQVSKIGKVAVACEYSPHGRKYAAKAGVDIHAFDLTLTTPTDIEGRFDLAYCFEIAEHLTPAMGESLVRFLVGKGDTVVFTAAQPGQGGSGHINEQPREYWIERFLAQGAIYDADATASLASAFAAAAVSHWFADNLSVFRSNA